MDKLFTLDEKMDKAHYGCSIIKSYFRSKDIMEADAEIEIEKHEIKDPVVSYLTFPKRDVICMIAIVFKNKAGFELFKKENSDLITKINIYNGHN